MTNKYNKVKTVNEKSILKKCHVCGFISEGKKEMENCQKCKKAFLPLNYFEKVHDQSGQNYKALFSESHELCEEDIIKGLYVLW